MIPNGALNHHTWRSPNVMLDSALRNVALAGIACNTYVVITVYQITADICKRRLAANRYINIYSDEPIVATGTDNFA